LLLTQWFKVQQALSEASQTLSSWPTINSSFYPTISLTYLDNIDRRKLAKGYSV